MTKDEYLKEYFPDVTTGVKPCGAKLLVQLRTIKEKTQGGLILVEETKEFNNGNTQLARIVATGDIAFCNRDTGDTWKEGVWAKKDDIVVIPRWGGFRFEIPIPGTKDKAIFATIPDTSVEMVVEGNFEAFDKLL